MTAPNDVRRPVELSVVVPCYNGAARLARLLPGLVGSLDVLAESGVPSELVVVDNGSTDETAEAARAAAPGAKVTVLSPNRGSSGARNAGAREAEGRWLLLCDDDVEVPAQALRSLWDARTPGACVVPQVRDLRGALQNAVTARWHLGDLKLVELPDPIDEVVYPMSACLLLERDLYWAAGGFDERFQPNCYEDPAFGFALREVGGPIRMICESTVIHHVHGGATPEERERRTSEHKERYKLLIYKNRWLFDLLVLRGWRRWQVVSLGLPRTMLESVRTRSPGPVLGYFRAWRIFIRDRRPAASNRSPAASAGRATSQAAIGPCQPISGVTAR